MSDCERFHEDLSALLDGMLPRQRAAEVRAHMERCPDCTALYAAFSALSENMEQQEVPPGLHDRVMNAVRSASAPKKKGRLLWLRPALTAAACVAVIAGAVLVIGNGWRAGSSGGASFSASSSAAAKTAPALAAGGADAVPAAAPEPMPMEETAEEEGAAYSRAESGEVPETYTVYDTGDGTAETSRTTGTSEAAEASGTVEASGATVNTSAASASSADEATAQSIHGAANDSAGAAEDRLLLTVEGKDGDALLCSVVRDPAGSLETGETLRVILPPQAKQDGEASAYAPGASLLILPERWEILPDGQTTLYAAEWEFNMG